MVCLCLGGGFSHTLLFLVSQESIPRFFFLKDPGYYLENTVSLFLSSKCVLQVFSYVLEKKYWLSGSKITTSERPVVQVLSHPGVVVVTL